MDKSLQNSLHHSIVLTLGLYGSIEWLVFHILAWVHQFKIIFYLSFVIVQILFHVAIYIFLRLTKDFFFLVETKQPLFSLNTANKITLLRISMLPSIVFLIIAVKHYSVGTVLLVAIAITFITDLIDGRISRTFHQVTYIGRILDSVSDYSVLLVIGITYYIYTLIPTWLLIVILGRLLFQAFGMLALLIKHRSVEPKPTIFGKVAIASIMVLFALEPLKLIAFHDIKKYMVYIEILVSVIVFLSVFDKAWFFHKERISKRLHKHTIV
ncbi:MAG TPA: CDP-alcohol phosphatidyltransferase family protein [Treponema sp.]|nr:CDP-alcohol phosphatidyltransferase family protein [Treponema sp.]HRS04170.1 CDP-alcohol phosphatidyltransferase family protein [Treponema sp.]